MNEQLDKIILGSFQCRECCDTIETSEKFVSKIIPKKKKKHLTNFSATKFSVIIVISNKILQLKHLQKKKNSNYNIENTDDYWKQF